MRFTVLNENTAGKRGFLAEHGLSVLIVHQGRKILFDTGQTDVFLHNAEKIGETLSDLDAIILSHGHFDHCGGLEYLAKQIAGDGEGCTRLFEVTCNGAATKEDAKIISKSVVCSTLTKAAVFGKDANWGRILCALGYAGVDFDPVKVDISLKSEDGVIEIVKDGIATDYSEDEATKVLSADAVTADIDVHNGVFEATAWGCDLTHDYVTINADYRS